MANANAKGDFGDVYEVGMESDYVDLNADKTNGDEYVYDFVPPISEISKPSMQPMSIEEPIKEGKPTGVFCSWKKMCICLTLLVFLVLTSLGLGVVGTFFHFYGSKETPDTGAGSGISNLNEVPNVLCPSVKDSYASAIAFSSPTVHHFPNLTDVYVTYSWKDKSVKISLEAKQHRLQNFTQGTTTVHALAMNSDGRNATCQFTYTRLAEPTIICPSISSSGNESIVFDSPVIKNFFNPERVYITYSEYQGRLLQTFPAHTRIHKLEGLKLGLNNLTVLASEGLLFASCDIVYYRRPEIRCPDPVQTSLKDIFVTKPATNFEDTAMFYYSKSGKLFNVFDATSSRHSLLNFDINVTDVTITAVSSGGLEATCTFTVDRIATSDDVRLVDGGNQFEGRVEVYHDNIWGTVCDDSWDAIDAQLVCKQLNYPHDNAIPRNQAFFGQGEGPIWLDDVSCGTYATGLASCSHGGWGTHNCGHGEDAGVVCNTDPFLIRLVDQIEGGGRVEVFYNGQWGTVCDDSWDKQDAIVVCRHLGLPYGAAEAPDLAYFGEGRPEQTIWIDEVRCRGTENRFEECSHSGWGNEDCSHYEDASVICKDGVNVVRLVDGRTPFEGRVEILHNGVWGTICSDSWDTDDAMVVCRQLGFPREDVDTSGDAQFGQGVGDIWLGGVDCVGHEAQLSECAHNGWGNYGSCSHSMDAGVICK